MDVLGLKFEIIWIVIIFANVFVGYFRNLKFYIECIKSTEIDVVLTKFQKWILRNYLIIGLLTLAVMLICHKNIILTGIAGVIGLWISYTIYWNIYLKVSEILENNKKYYFRK